MKKPGTIVLYLTLLAVLLMSGRAEGQFLYLSMFETNRFNEQLWFSPGNYWGNVHSNDYFNFSSVGDTICGILSTSQDGFHFARGMSLDDLVLGGDPIINLPEIGLPETENIRRYASPRISSHNGRVMTRVRFEPSSILFYQYLMGSQGPGLYDEDSLIARCESPAWGAYYVDGEAEVYGMVTGNVTLGTSGDMWLLGDIRYYGADQYTGQFDEDRMWHSLGLVSERDIIIKDNWVNGRENGFRRHSGYDIAHHSIVINAALVAPHGTLRIEHTNADWEPYQGPEPDERGIVNLKGMVALWRGAQLHNDNHGSTGYRVNMHYDYRFDMRPPPFIEVPWVWGGWREEIYAYSNSLLVVIMNSECRRLYVYPGAELRYDGSYTVIVRDRLEFTGSPDQPVTVTYPDWGRNRLPAEMLVRGGMHPMVELSNIMVEEGVELRFDADSILVDSCSFAGRVTLRGRYVEVQRSRFGTGVALDAWGNVSFSHNLIEGEVRVTANPRSCSLINNTIVNPEGDGVFLHTFRELGLRNNIVVFCRRGVVNRHWRAPVLEYNDVFANSEGNYIDCQPGECSISADPLFVNREEGDYNLGWGSPCIDAGAPESPPDPDGSRADIGAFYFDHRLTAPGEVSLPTELALTVAPNPFNHSLIIRITADRSGQADIEVYDLAGRRVGSQRYRLSTGGNQVTLDGELFGQAGVYIVQVRFNGRQETMKVLYLP